MTKEQLQWAMYEAYVAQLLNRIEAQEAEIARLGTMAEQTRADAVTRAAADEKRIEALRHESERWKAAYSDRCALLDVIHASLGIDKGDKDVPNATQWVEELRGNTEVTHDTPEGKDVAESVIRDDRKTEPKPGDTVRLVRIPSRDVVSPELRTVLEWPWIERWGTLNQTALVVEPAYQLDGALSVCLSTNVHVRWPISCIEVITEATHDTEAGKAVAESAVSETVADEIKVGDLCEVFQATTRTLKTDIGITGRVSSVHLDPCHGGFLVKFDPSTQSRRSTGMQAFGLCDVRKVTT